MEKWTPKNNQENSKLNSYEILAKYWMPEIARKMNADLKKNYGEENLLNDFCELNMGAFKVEDGYSKNELEEDCITILQKEKQFFGAGTEDTKELFAQKYGVSSEEQIIQKRKEQRRENKAGQLEMLTVALFQKMVGDDFIVVHSSAYDDYENGIDTVMVNRKTGHVVCGIDEVHDHTRSDRLQKKKERQMKKISAGASLRYGITIDNGTLKKKKMSRLPTFIISLSTDQLEKILCSLKTDTLHTITNEERGVFSHFLSSFESQQKEMLNEKRAHREVRKNLESFSDSLKTMRDTFQSKL